MEATDYKLDLKCMKQDLLRGINECSQRGLLHSVKWLAELNHALSHVKLTPEETPIFKHDLEDELESYLLAKSYFDLKEYDRAAFFVSQCHKPKARFLYFYASYMSIEKRKLDNMTDANCPPDPAKNDELNDLCTEFKNDFYEDKLDAYCMYLYGVILKKLDLNSLAVDAYLKAVKEEPILWCAWYELGKLMPDKNKIFSIQLPDHWIKLFFLAHTYLEQLNNDEAIQIYTNLSSQGLENSTYIMSQLALGHHNRRGKLYIKHLIHLASFINFIKNNVVINTFNS